MKTRTHTHLETSRRERMIWVETMLSYVVMLWHQGGQPIPVGDAGALLAPGCPSGGGEIRPFYRGLGVPTGSRISTSWKISPYCYMIFLLFLIQEQDYSIIPSNVATCARPGSHGSTDGTKHGGFNQIYYVYAHIHTYTRAHTHMCICIYIYTYIYLFIRVVYIYNIYNLLTMIYYPWSIDCWLLSMIHELLFITYSMDINLYLIHHFLSSLSIIQNLSQYD
jgi:hypothetical protein